MRSDEILKSYIYRYNGIQYIVDVINEIRSRENLQDVLKDLEIVESKIRKIEFDKKKIILIKESIDYKEILNNCEKGILKDLSIFESNQSIAKGFSGVLLTKKYFNINVNDKDIDEYFKNIEKRCLGLYYGLAGQLYLSAVYNIKNDEILNYINKNINKIITKKDYSIDIGLSGIGLSIVYYYKKFNDIVAFDLAKNIADDCLNIVTSKSVQHISNDLGFEKGLSGIAYFLLAVYSITNEEKYYAKADEIIDVCIKSINVKSKKTTKMVIGNNEFRSPYIKDGEFSIIIVMLYAQHLKYNKLRDGYINKILEKNINYFSLSNGFYEGTGGMIYTYLKAYSLYNDSKYLEYSKIFINDIYFSYKDGYFVQEYNRKNINNYLYGNLSLISLMNMYENNLMINLFPYIF